MQRIVVGVDTSDRAAFVLSEAIALAQAGRAKLIVVRGIGLPVEFPLEALSIAPDAMPATLQKITQQGLDRFVAKVPPDVFERAEARIGTPWQVVCDAAKEHHANLVIVGTHGHGAIDRLLGTTAARVVNHAPCSVLVVREPPKA